jgi:energy-coupling factor transporter ATP-binding protein EcfA2
MIDFMKISTKNKNKGNLEIYPKFIINNKSSDLMIRGGDFYAVWIKERGLWSTDEQDVIHLIDKELDRYAEEYRVKHNIDHVDVAHMWDAESGSIDLWHKYCQKQMRDNFHALDEKLIFANTETKKTDYASKRLSYPLEEGSIEAYDKLISTLYSEEERHKIEWAIGSIISGDSKKIQKFMVLYGAAGTGKSTILNIIQQLFEGYYSVFDAKALGSSSNSFALEAFKTNPLVAIQHDGDLSRIEDNTRLNSLVSHELMTVNEKFKSTYSNRFNAFLFMGTNKPVKITDGKSGLIRRLIDVTPSGNKVSAREYKTIMKQISFELGAIAKHCLDVYMNDPTAYDSYIPTSMLGASNDFYNFIIDSYHIFKKEDGTTLKAAWEMYRTYCDDANVPYPFSRRNFKEELKNYFWEFNERFNFEDGSRVRSYYSGFRTDIFETEKKPEGKNRENNSKSWISLQAQSSIFDQECKDCLAQYATTKETPGKKWESVKSTLSELDTSKLHYVKVPENHIVIDFDIKGDDGKKSFERNLEEASKWPATYAELSKSGAGIHLHYIYNGDPSKLSRVYEENIEVKVFTGKSSLRRKLTKCNDLPIATISSGLPLKGDKKMVNSEVIKSEKGLRSMIERNLNKEIHPGTKPSIDFIYKILEDAYSQGLNYDVTDMRNEVLAFAAQSTNQADYCIKLVNKMKFKSEEPSVPVKNDDAKLIFYDIEVFPNLFLVNWKVQGEGKPVVRMINPTPSDIEELIHYRLVGFNCRRYDNHILYARLMGYTNEQLYRLSQKIISGDRNAFFGEAYNLSYTDVYDFASAGNKKSLKKLEIEMGIHHQELGLPWDEPVPEELWPKVAEYCDNDVIATEAAFNYLSADWTARQILADLAGMSVNDTTNSLTTRIIFGKNRKPQNEFCYRDLSKPVTELDPDVKDFLTETFPEMMSMKHGPASLPFNREDSLLPYFEGYKFENGKSTYRGEEVGEGGFAQGVPGMYVNVALLDIASMHPHSVMAECLFGPRFTRAFRDIVYGRVNIKHKAWDEVNHMLDGKLTPYIQKVIDGEMTAKELANALKTAINSVYGLTSASFDNPFRDIRNKDNIVAKRGALFMIDLKNAVMDRGFKVAHIKTDSIKIPDATPEIIQFVMDFGKQYGYTFEHEATYDRMCLVNDAVYIAKYKDATDCKSIYGYTPGDNVDHGGQWTATGKQFAVPYLFKTLFSKEPIEFEDMCETFAVSKGDLYLDMNEDLPDVSQYEKELEKLENDYKKGKLSDTTFEPQSLDLVEKIKPGHSMHFVGRVGQFCPILPGHNGGVLYRVNDGKNYAAAGSTGYRWLESEMVKTLGKEDAIDRSFYQKLIDDAVDVISQYCDFEWFASDDPLDFMYIPEDTPDEIPFL